jgi:hypothetical protein
MGRTRRRGPGRGTRGEIRGELKKGEKDERLFPLHCLVQEKLPGRSVGEAVGTLRMIPKLYIWTFIYVFLNKPSTCPFPPMDPSLLFLFVFPPLLLPFLPPP